VEEAMTATFLTPRPLPAASRRRLPVSPGPYHTKFTGDCRGNSLSKIGGRKQNSLKKKYRNSSIQKYPTQPLRIDVELKKKSYLKFTESL
jgi:hypothetical protein